MTLSEFNGLDNGRAEEELLKCCGSTKWARTMARARPLHDWKEIEATADAVWRELGRSEFMEAFAHHLRIGDINNMEEKCVTLKNWGAAEQRGINGANEKTLKELAQANLLYEEKFGYIFIVCATEKSADEMLLLLRKRLKNNAETELQVAMEEQMKITLIRLRKILL